MTAFVILPQLSGVKIGYVVPYCIQSLSCVSCTRTHVVKGDMLSWMCVGLAAKCHLFVTDF
jgi:hypothetical protein